MKVPPGKWSIEYQASSHSSTDYSGKMCQELLETWTFTSYSVSLRLFFFFCLFKWLVLLLLRLLLLLLLLLYNTSDHINGHLLFASACWHQSSFWAIGYVILCVLTESISSSFLQAAQENALPWTMKGADGTSSDTHSTWATWLLVIP